MVFISLATYESETQDNRCRQPENGFTAMAGAQGVVRNRQGQARSQQQRGVNGGQPERANRFELGHSACGPQVGLGAGQVWPQQRLVVQVATPGRSEERRVGKEW